MSRKLGTIAEYINNFPDRQKLKIMFMRESDGVYQFGSKRVPVRVDASKINNCVGGGYITRVEENDWIVNDLGVTD